MIILLKRLKQKVKKVLGSHENVFKGFKMYHLPLLVSYSRSGTNWVSYILEMVSHSKVPDGFTKKTNDQNFFIDRAHNGSLRIHRYNKVILLLRNYKECIVRHHGMKTIRNASSTSNFLANKKMSQPAIWYVNNLISYDHFKKEKLVIYYEDLMSNPEETINLLKTFLKLDEMVCEGFLRNIEGHFNNSLTKYVNKGHQSYTKSYNIAVGFHENQLTKEEKKEFDDYFLEKCGDEIFSRYLRRYV